MELTAVIQALAYAENNNLYNEKITLYMDSIYVHDGITHYLAQRVRR